MLLLLVLELYSTNSLVLIYSIYSNYCKDRVIVYLVNPEEFTDICDFIWFHISSPKTLKCSQVFISGNFNHLCEQLSILFIFCV